MNGCCDGSWDGSPYVDGNGDLKAIVLDEFGNHYTATIIKGKVAGYRCGPSVDGGPSQTFVLYAGAEVYVKVNNYLKDSQTIINWIEGAKFWVKEVK